MISKFKENSIQNHSDSSDGVKVHKLLLYVFENIIFRNKLLFISKPVELNVKEQNTEAQKKKFYLNLKNRILTSFLLFEVKKPLQQI